MRTLGLIRRGTAGPSHDLWPRLCARLAADDVVALRVPPIGWLEATAIAVVVGTIVLVPDPVRFLSACGLL